MKTTMTIVAGLLAWMALAGVAHSQPDLSVYRVGPGDVIQLAVWQQPDLDRELRVRDDGTIVVPLVGQVDAAGKTLPELEDLLTRRLRSFNRDITEISLTISAYNSFEIYVMGAVENPGQLSFDFVPNVWDALRAAGGPLPSANLRRVRILRPLDQGTNTIVSDVSGMLTGSDAVHDVPLLQAGDTVVVPDVLTIVPADREFGVHVLGAVAEPGLYPVEEPSPLMTVIIQAGGFADDASLGDVRWVHETGGGENQARRIDVRGYLRHGQPSGNPLVHPGDTLYVESAQGGVNVVQALTLSTGLAALLLNLLK